MQPVILRLPMVYGRGAKGNFRRLVEAVARGRWLPLASIDRMSLAHDEWSQFGAHCAIAAKSASCFQTTLPAAATCSDLVTLTLNSVRLR